MRKHQYRGQRVDTKEWVYGYYFITPLTIENFGIGHLGDSVKRHCISNVDGVVFAVIPDTVGEFAGRQDRNKKDAYEGDICETIERDIALDIRWDEAESGLRFYDNVNEVWFELNCLKVTEITGSVHDSPELMK